METTILFPAENELDKSGEAFRMRPSSCSESDISEHRVVWCIVAVGSDGSIGRGGEIPWRLREDLKRFKEITMGHPVIMGRKTWESLPKKPLPGRRNIVVTRDAAYEAPGGETAGSIEEAVALCQAEEVPVIIGGEQIYRQSLPWCTRVYLTEVDMTVPDADAWFPKLDECSWKKTEESEWLESAHGIRYRYIRYDRK